MDRARNYDSETPVEKLNPTSTTDVSYKTLCIIFLGHPVGHSDADRQTVQEAVNIEISFSLNFLKRTADWAEGF